MILKGVVLGHYLMSPCVPARECELQLASELRGHSKRETAVEQSETYRFHEDKAFSAA